MLKDDVCFYELKKVTEMKLKSKRDDIKNEVAVIDTSTHNDESVENLQSNLTVIAFKLPFVAGSKESMKLLICLCSLGDSEIFSTTLVQRILSHKWLKVRKIGYILTFIYVLYIISLTAV